MQTKVQTLQWHIILQISAMPKDLLVFDPMTKEYLQLIGTCKV